MEKVIDYFIGLLRSWSAWLGASILALPEWWPLISDQLYGLLGDSAKNQVIRLMGILVILVRFKTKESLSEKGMKTP